MNEKVLKTLEYDKITQQLLDFLQTPLGRQEAEQLAPSIDIVQINQWLQETADAVLIDRLKGGIPLAKLADIKPHLKRLDIHASLSALELAEVGAVLRNTRAIANFLSRWRMKKLGRPCKCCLSRLKV